MTELGNVSLHFDGSCWPNPGGEASYGWHIASDENTAEIARGSGPVTDKLTSNNVAEWRAVEAGLSWLQCLNCSIKNLSIIGDSQLVIRQLNGEWGCKKAHLGLIRDECLRLIRKIAPESWTCEWIPRERNSRADELSRMDRKTIARH